MIGQAQQAFVEANVAYHRQQLIDGMSRTHRTSRPARVSWVQGLIDALTGSGRASHGKGNGPSSRPAGAPHHATSH